MIVTKVKVQNQKVISQPSAPAETSNSGIRVSTDDIRVQQSHIYSATRGSKHGHDIQDWLKAERQITQR